METHGAAIDVALFRLRRIDASHPRPFEVPLYPLVPALFCASCLYMLWSSLSYVHSQALGGFNAAWVGVIVLALGGVVLAGLRFGKGGDRPASPAAPLRPPME